MPFPIKSMSTQLPVANLERAIRFYTEVLGFELSFRYEDFYAGVARDGFSIHLKEGKPNGNKVNGDIDLMFAVEDLEGIYRQFAGEAIIQPLREMPYGKEFYIEDPDGYVLAFLQVD